MARKKKVISGVDQKSAPLKLPKSIELICTATGEIKEFSTDHAQRILALQKKSGLGTFHIYNEELYQYDEVSKSIKHIIRPSEESVIDTISEE